MSAALGGWAAAASIAVAAVYWAISFSRYEVGGAANASGSANANANANASANASPAQTGRRARPPPPSTAYGVKIHRFRAPIAISISRDHFALRYEVPKFLARGGHLCMAMLTITAVGPCQITMHF